MVPQKRCCIRSSFIHNVLSSLSALQSTKGSNSIKLDDLVKFMEYTHNLSGDVRSQVESALNNARDMNFVNKVNDRYSLICPAARVHLVPSICLKAEIKRIEGIFHTKRRRNSTTSLCSSPNRSICRSRSRSRSLSPSRCRKDTPSPVNTRPKRAALKTNPICACSTPKNTAFDFLNSFWPSALSPTEMKNNCTNTKPKTRSCNVARKQLSFNLQKRTPKKKKNCPPRRKNSLDELRDRILANANQPSCNPYCPESSSSSSA